MTTYNGERYLQEQIDSILNQTYSNFELIICDDCSTDSTIEIISSYNDSRIKLFVNDKNLGFKKNFEKAIKLCTGEYIALSDQDDIWKSNHLEVLYEKINNKELICGNNLLINENIKQYYRFIEFVSKLVGIDLPHERFKLLALDEFKAESKTELKIKALADSYMYLINNINQSLTTKIIKNKLLFSNNTQTKIKSPEQWLEFLARPTGFEPVTCRLEI